MIGYIKGDVLNVDQNTILIENGGIGYEVTCSSSALGLLVANGSGAVYTYMAVKEDGVSLYGFSTLEEKAMFLKLITVSGVGAKMGIQILSEMKLYDLALAIAQNNVKALSSIKGIGKKTAERIILELREKVSGEEVTGTASVSVAINKDDEEAIVALTSLGFTRQESAKAVVTAKEQGAKTLEQLIALSLKNIR